MNPLNPLYNAVAWVLTKIYNGLSPIFGPDSGWTWALTIIILVVLMRMLMVPLFIKQMHTTRAMAALTPQMTALRKKYKNDKQTLQQETMKLYQEAGVNPLMGCLPVLLQLPLFFALFSVLKAIADYTTGVPKYNMSVAMVQSAQKASIFGATISDRFLFQHPPAPLHARLVILIAVMISMTTTYLTVRQSMKRGMMPAATPDNPMAQSQKYMAYIMPLFALSGLYWPFGLVLYWVTTNLWTLGQQFVLLRRYPVTAPAGADGTAAASAAGAAVLGKATRPALTSGRSSGSTQLNGGSAGRGSTARGNASRGSGQRSQPASAKPRSGGKESAAGPSGPSSGDARAGGTSAGRARASGSGEPAPTANGSKLRWPGRKPPPAPDPEPDVTKLVRQQPQRQSRSKRSGKR